MIKIKLCGMFRECDIEYVNEALPDYIGFILNFPKSHRNIDAKTAKRLKAGLNSRIQAVGVFVNSPPEYCADCANRGIIDLIQLHGSEDAEYVASLRKICSVPLIKAVKVTAKEDIERVLELDVDYLLLDSGTGSGKSFDHNIMDGVQIKKPFFIAGGFTPENLTEAIKFKPYAVDLSSGIETDKLKDREKILKAVRTLRDAQQ